MNTLNYAHRLEELEMDISNKFNDLIEEHNDFNFLDALMTEYEIEPQDGMTNIQLCEEHCEMNDLPIYEMRNDITGNVFDVQVISVDKTGIYVVEYEDTTEQYVIRLSELNSVEYRIQLLTEMVNLK
jgi:hypothetical protein